jgi:hypothetical protein
MSEIAKEVNLPEPVELTDAELSAVAGGAPNGDITPSTEVVTINPPPSEAIRPLDQILKVRRRRQSLLLT